jgi:hypothetical protein
MTNNLYVISQEGPRPKKIMYLWGKDKFEVLHSCVCWLSLSRFLEVALSYECWLESRNTIKNYQNQRLKLSNQETLS